MYPDYDRNSRSVTFIFKYGLWHHQVEKEAVFILVTGSGLKDNAPICQFTNAFGQMFPYTPL
jgi:hypothetical protein